MIRGNAGFRWTPVGGGSVQTFALASPLRLREGAAARVKTRHREIALDERTIETVVLGGGANELDAAIRYTTGAAALLLMLEAGADGAILNYFPDLDAAGAFFPFALMGHGARVEIKPDRARYGLREWETAVRLRRIDGGSITALLEGA